MMRGGFPVPQEVRDACSNAELLAKLCEWMDVREDLTETDWWLAQDFKAAARVRRRLERGEYDPDLDGYIWDLFEE